MKKFGGNLIVPTDLLDCTECRLQGGKYSRFQKRMMANKLIYCRSNDHCILFVNKNFQMTLRRKDSENGRNDTRSIAQLRLSNFIQT